MIIYILSQLIFKVKQIKSQLSTRLYDFTKTLRFRYRNILFSFFGISYNEGVIKKKETTYEKENENRIDNIVLAYDGNSSDVPVRLQ